MTVTAAIRTCQRDDCANPVRAPGTRLCARHATSAKLPAVERDYQQTILGAAKITGWRSAHFRPGRTMKGWRTAVGGDGKGFPDLVLIHPEAGFVWFVELKRDDNRGLDPDQEAWRLDLTAAGAVHIVVHCPSGLNSFLGRLDEARTTKLRHLRMGLE